MNSKLVFRTSVAFVSALSVVGLLAGCITVNVPEPEASETVSSARPAPSASTSQVEASPEVTVEETFEEVVEESAGEQEALISQSIDYTISGGCQDSYEQVGYYGVFEEFGDDCYLIVEVSPPIPSRTAKLQYFDSGWTTESTDTTDSEGFAYLEVDQYCDDGYWCDGVWDYRIFVEASDGLPSDTSITFELDFIAY